MYNYKELKLKKVEVKKSDKEIDIGGFSNGCCKRNYSGRARWYT